MAERTDNPNLIVGPLSVQWGGLLSKAARIALQVERY